MSEYTLYNADCLDILPTLNPQSVDAVICDPPYGTTACKWDSVIPFAPMWAGIKRVLKPRGACVLFGSQPFTSALVMSNPEMFRYEWVWNKSRGANFVSVGTQPLKKHENVLVFSRQGATYNPQMSAGEKYLTRVGADRSVGVYGQAIARSQIKEVCEVRYPDSVLCFSSMRQQDMIHPTQKPLALLEYLVKTYTNEGETVLDFTMGSGTTGHACGNLGRRFVGIEKDANYFSIAQERIATAYAPLRAMQVAV